MNIDIALVTVSPSFRQCESCVRELNNMFMKRYHQHEGGAGNRDFRVVVLLWKKDDLDDYPSCVQHIVRIRVNQSVKLIIIKPSLDSTRN